MFTPFNIPFRLPQLPSFAAGISLKPVTVHAIEENADKRCRTLKHLLKANHINHALIYSRLRFHNHTPHILGSAYIFGADTQQLNHIYDVESRQLEPWSDSPGEIAKHDWRDFRGRRDYQRAFVDFFEDQLVSHGYDWHSLLHEFLFAGKEPLINNLISGLAHPLIHLGYAEELSSRTLAIESLAHAACFYNDWHKYLDQPAYTKPARNPSDSLFTILDRVRADKRFDGLFDHRGSDNISTLLADPELEKVALEYWNSWSLTKPKEQFAESQKLAVALLVAAQSAEMDAGHYDFFVVHLLTSSHAVRVLLPQIPSRWHLPLGRQWWLFTLLVYIAQQRPPTNIDTIKLVDLDGRDWRFVTDRALSGPHRADSHFVKALRSMHEAGSTWGDANEFFLKAAVKMADEFRGWGGFGPSSEEAEEHGALGTRSSGK